MIVLSEGGINSSVSIEVFLFVGLAGEIDLMEIVEAIMDGLEEALLCEGVIGLMVRFWHQNSNKDYNKFINDR